MNTVNELYNDLQCIGCGSWLPPKFLNRKLCKLCYKRSQVWGVEGVQMLHNLAKDNKSLTRFESLEFCKRYYIGRSLEKHSQMSIFETSLKLIGWEGKITGKRRRYLDYQHIRFQGFHQNLKRVGDEGKCAICGRSDIKLYYHHLFPITWGGDPSDPNNGVVVCKSHHLELHKRLKKKLSRTLLIKYLEPYKEDIKKMVEESLPEELRK